jgi:hypothetical protein
LPTVEVGLACNWSMLNQVEIPLAPFSRGKSLSSPFCYSVNA